MNLIIAGVDEVGRGPLAGPVVAAAVIIDEVIEGIADSKKLPPLKRQKLALLIKEKAIAYAYGRAEVEEIDQLNIHHATLLAMQRAIEGLKILPHKIYVDGIHTPKTNIPIEAIIKGDSLIYQISAASILAKVARDDEMAAFEAQYPGYDFAKHKGYPTLIHRQQLQKLGPCPIHRKSFAPVAQCMLLM